jgi:hypothetical protein
MNQQEMETQPRSEAWEERPWKPKEFNNLI